MVLSLLRLFPAFRTLEAELEILRSQYATLEHEKLSLQDRLDASMAERERVWNMAHRCLEGERTAYQMHINQSWQRMGGGVPYPEAPHLAPQAVPKPDEHGTAGRKGRMLMSEAIAEKTNEYLEKLVQR